MSAARAEDVKRRIAVIWENLQCPICLDLMTAPVSTRCDHQFCKFCLMKLLERSKSKEASCPVCKIRVTKRSLKESPGFQRLVEGLQSLVQSYEFDTRTSYFTGLPQSRTQTSVAAESRGQQSSEDSVFSGNDVMDKSLSSSAVKDAFAELMGLVDSCTVNSEQEGFGSSPGAPENKADELQDVPSRTEACDGGSDGKTDRHNRRSSRGSKRVGLKPDRIADKRQKKSVEKVAEWLLKISPSSDAQTRENSRVLAVPTDSDSERESRCSSSPTDANQKTCKKDNGGPPKEVTGRGLEEKVFGAVYRRERKGVETKTNRAVVHEKEKVTNPVPIILVQEEEVSKKKSQKRKRSFSLTPADFIKKIEEPKDSTRTAVEDHSVELDTEEEVKPLAQECNKIAENSDDKCEDTVETMDESPAFEVPVKRPGRRSKSKMKNVLPIVDLDLKEKENDNRGSRKRRSNRGNCQRTKDGHLEESKKCTKSLTLVDAACHEDVDVMEQLKSKHQLVKAEINIESYPSSADLRSPDARMMRRSLRLKAFITDVQGTQKQRRSTKVALKPASEPEPNPLSCLDHLNVESIDANKDVVDASQDHASTQQSCIGNEDQLVRKNGCIFNSNLEVIEAVQTNEEMPIVPCVSDKQVPEEHAVQTAIPDTVPSKVDLYSLNSSLPEKIQESTSTGIISPSVPQTLRDAPCEHGCTDEEAETNDSELDTELIMKSFKTTKRKSFYLGSSKPLPDANQERVRNKADKEEKPQHQPLSSTAVMPPLCEDPSPRSQSSFGIAGLLQAKVSTSFLKNSGNSSSSGLSPNRAARSQDSKLPTNNSDSATSLQGFFANVTQETSLICSSEVQKNNLLKSPCQPRATEMLNKPIQGYGLQTQRSLDLSDRSANVPARDTPNLGVHSNNDESSTTPDGLLPEGAVLHECNHVMESKSSRSLGEDAETLSQPCVPRKRKAQRLESSESEVSVEDDSLPTLAHIFKSHCSPSHSGQEPPQKSDHQEPDLDLQSPGEHNLGNDLNEATPVARSSQLSQCVGLYQNQEHAENETAIADGRLSQPSCRDEWITSSQGSVDLFGTPEESEAAGICGNFAISRDSSQYSSEIITTQQKEEMQQDLRRLEKMMALVSEALQKKEMDTGSKPQDPALDPTGLQSAPDLEEAALSDPRNRQSGLGSGDHMCRPPGAGPPDHPGDPRPPLMSGQAKTERRAGGSRQRSEGRARRASQKAKAGLALQDPNGLGTELPEGNRSKGARREPGSCRPRRMELVASGLSAGELTLVKKFARKMHGYLSEEMSPATTHVIIKTGEDLVCQRTLKYFQGIAGRKWVVSFLWISECFNQGKVLDEAQFEVRGDVVNGHNHKGPLRSRTTAEDELLMKGYEICFQGSFTAMTTDQMEAMVEMCGAAVVKDPLMFSKHGECQLVVVQPGSDDSQSYYRALQKKATVVARSWLLDTIATYTLQNPEDYKP